jgi:hypothetical protein
MINGTWTKQQTMRHQERVGERSHYLHVEEVGLCLQGKQTRRLRPIEWQDLRPGYYLEYDGHRLSKPLCTPVQYLVGMLAQ